MGGYVRFSMYYVNNNFTAPVDMFLSYGRSDSSLLPPRPVVKLDSSVKLEKDLTIKNTWNIK